jgi:cytochrome c oxidase cbb3-type subunit 3/ubiquinol-cytochrome c reductase cytochrome c subunit
MPAFARANGGPLTDAEVQVLADGIKKRWGPAASGDAPPYFNGAGSTGANKDEGTRVFAQACAHCHGKAGEGVERDGRLRRKINDPAFLALISDKALRRVIITGRPDLGMPAYDGTRDRPADFRPLTSAQIDDLVALLASWRQCEPGGDKK